jgi:DNA-binding response OmpR family regulator
MKRRTKPMAKPRRTSTVLVIDADSATRQLLQDLLRPQGFQVHLAADADTGLALCQTYRPDCVLLDTRTPVPDGFEVLRTLRALPGGHGMTIVMMSTHADRSSWLAWDNGPDMYLTKPFATDHLLDYLCPRLPATDQSIAIHLESAAQGGVPRAPRDRSPVREEVPSLERAAHRA